MLSEHEILTDIRTCEAIKEKTNAFAVGRANKVAVSEERRVALVERDGGQIAESRVGYGD